MAVWNLNKLIEHLKQLSLSDREISNTASWLWEEGMGYSQHQQEDLSVEAETRLQGFIERLSNGEPVQYIVGHAYFFGLKIKVTPAVLIPRPETEELVEWIIEDAKEMKPVIRMLDIGTGSGCIPIVLKNYHKKNADVTSIDISNEALEVASDNCIMHKANVKLIRRDFLKEGISDLGTFNVIVSNPPYISKSAASEDILKGLAFEPQLALFPPGTDPDIFYRVMSEQLSSQLEEGGAVYIEINEFRANEIAQLFEQKGWKVELRSDMQGAPRMMKLIYPTGQRNE
jgi:release factor glutamine methyltransferase